MALLTGRSQACYSINGGDVTTDMLLRTAAHLAPTAHRGQKRTGLDEAYIKHPLRVAAMAHAHGLDADAQAAAMLHDVVEDCTGWTYGRLAEAGIPDRTVTLVRLLTKWWVTADCPDNHEDKAEYYRRILTDPAALALKLLDRTDNLRDLRRVLPNKRKWAMAYAGKTIREFSLLSATASGVGLTAIAEEFNVALTDVCVALLSRRTSAK